MQKSKFFTLLALGAILLNGCYSTTPRIWTSRQDREVIDSKLNIPNGTRTEIRGKIVGDEIQMTSVEIPQCRLSDIIHPVMKERGQREGHSWPAALVGVGMAIGGAALIADGLSRPTDQSDQEDIMIAEFLGGGAIGGGGLITAGICGLADCSPETGYDTREVNGSQFKRWTGEDKKDCVGAVPRISPNIPILLSTNWEKHKTTIKWKLTATDGQGLASMKIAGAIRQVSAHCGVAKTVIRIDTLRPVVVEDTPDRPANTRDDSGVFSFNINPTKEIASPHAIVDPNLRSIAEECALKNQTECAGSRAASIKTRCETDCNSQGGGAYCEEQRNIELSMPGLSDEERTQIGTRYAGCIKEHRVDTSASNSCASACIEKALNTICPNPWK